MQRIGRKNFYALIFILFFICIGFFGITINKLHAAGLEVQYPQLPNGAGGTGTVDSNVTLPNYAVYLFRYGMFAGFFIVFLSLAFGGVMYILSPGIPGIKSDTKASAKEIITGSLTALLILALATLMVNTISPNLGIFGNSNTPQETVRPPSPQQSGVYFYKQSGCSNNSSQNSTTDLPDLGDLKNKVSSVGIVQGAGGYITILYDTVNFQGKCQFLDSNQKCQTPNISAQSASILNYNSSPSGDGVYFYRKPCFNKVDNPFKDISSLVSYCNGLTDGYYEVKNSDIINNSSKKGYIADLNQLKFQNVPQADQDCVKFDADGECDQNGRQPPTLGGDNISSIIINGHYAVLFIYASSSDNPSGGPWSYCEMFPQKSEDTNNIGPQQIKWENIRNHSDLVPNYVMIIPVQ